MTRRRIVTDGLAARQGDLTPVKLTRQMIPTTAVVNEQTPEGART